jgi:Ca2+-binding EF-hand superfamily protein
MDQDQHSPDTGSAGRAAASSGPGGRNRILAESDEDSDGPDPDAPPPPPPPPASGDDDEEEEEGAGGVGAYAVALPGEEDLGFGEERFKHVRPGRLTVTVIAAEDIYKPERRGQATKIDPYVKLEVGRGVPKPLRVKSAVVKNAGSSPNWGGQAVALDMGEPMGLVADDTILMHYEVWDNNIFADTKLGEGSVSLLRFFGYLLDPVQGPRQHWLPLTLTPKAGRGGQAARAEPAGKLLVGVHFQPANPGLLVVTTMEAVGLRNMDMFGKQDPYVALELDDQKVRGTTVRKGGTDPYLNDEELELIVTRQNWGKPLRVAMYDEDPGRDDFIGDCMMSLLDLTSLRPGNAGAIENTFTLTANKKDAGKLRVGFRFFPAGELTIEVVEGKRLANRETVGHMDPYVKLTVAGSRHPVTQRSSTDHSGGSEPVWNETMKWDVVSESECRLEVWDADTFTKDDIVGSCAFSLLPVFKSGFRDHWYKLSNRTAWGKVETAGDIFLKIDFKGPLGVPFPQRQPDMDSFDESERVTRGGEMVVERAKRLAAQAAAAEAAAGASAEFTDQEVEDAFTFLDLDGNKTLSAAELRHVLVCMGELITDEEIDEMIRMVDADGDGQVSFDEFRRVALHPDPASAEFDVLVQGEEGDQAAAIKAITDVTAAASGAGGRQPPPPPSGTAAPKTSKAARIAKEKAAREERKRFLKRFVADQRLRVPDLQRAWEHLLEDRPIPKGGAAAAASSGWSDLVSFEEMCDVFGAEATGEARQLYSVFVDADLGRVPLRRLLLALCGFCGADSNQRVNLCFFLFDDDKSGTIDEEELRQILRANHLATDISQVENKTKHVLAQADKDGDGEIDMEEFIVLSAKMPNLIWGGMAEETDG